MGSGWRSLVKLRRLFGIISRDNLGTGGETNSWLGDDFEVPQLDDIDGGFLTRPFEEDEVKQAVWDCDCSKSPGPDGFNFDFFKGCWGVVREDVMRMVREFFIIGKLVKGCNSSFIVLIPKKEGGWELTK